MKTSVMIVDSDKRFRDGLIERLSPHRNIRAVGVGSEEGAMELLKKEDIDVVVMGGAGFRQGGLALLTDVKAQSPLTEVVLMVTHGTMNLSIEGMKLGAFDDITIPFGISDLLGKIRRAAKRKRSLNRG